MRGRDARLFGVCRTTFFEGVRFRLVGRTPNVMGLVCGITHRKGPCL